MSHSGSSIHSLVGVLEIAFVEERVCAIILPQQLHNAACSGSLCDPAQLAWQASAHSQLIDAGTQRTRPAPPCMGVARLICKPAGRVAHRRAAWRPSLSASSSPCSTAWRLSGRASQASISSALMLTAACSSEEQQQRQQQRRQQGAAEQQGVSAPAGAHPVWYGVTEWR